MKTAHPPPIKTTARTVNATRPARLRHLLPAAFVAAATVVGASTVGHPGIANAEYDSTKYVACMQNYKGGDLHKFSDFCCVDAGGYLPKDGSIGCSSVPERVGGGGLEPGTPTWQQPQGPITTVQAPPGVLG
jgi:hypothetical protein